ncbi:MAG TPA: efflux RND transporter periplasmic adaptor subunit, partial [Rhodocyclaceae bacterium]|nr:efflux RND transporter periplasmic adaptor subunit [Rhodocyclaceae bacterium]
MAVVLVVVGALAAGGGYWFGTRFSKLEGTARDAGSAGAGVAAGTVEKSRKILYYRNPMGLADTSPTPKKDPMGMDYIPVYEGEEVEGADAATAGHAGQVRISAEKIQKLGVRVEAAGLRQLEGSVRALGRIEADERLIYTIAPKFEGYVERLHVNVTGQAVARGQPLFEVYSPELVSTQREYLIAIQGANAPNDTSDEARRGMRELAEASLMRLRNWDVADEQLASLARSGDVRTVAEINPALPA